MEGELNTQTLNALCDILLPEINSMAELKVLLFTIRRTLGRHKMDDYISFSQFERGTGMSRTSVSVGIKSCLARGTITRVSSGFRDGFVYEITLDNLAHSHQARRLAHRKEEAASPRSYGQAHYDRVADRNARHRAVERLAHVEPVSRAIVYARDGGRCHVCHKNVEAKRWHLDHLIPLSKGGEHSYRNVAVACPMCNMKRSNTGPAQLLLIV